MNLKVKTHDDHFQLTLNRPEKRNALNEEMMAEIVSALNSFEKSLTSQKYLLLEGSGESFCAGADLNWMKSMASFGFKENVEDSKKLFQVFHSLYKFPLPVVAVAKGHIFGGGLGLIAASDFVFMDEETKLCFSEVKLGLSPAVISSFVLGKCPKASTYMLSGELFDYKAAREMGLATDTLSALEGTLKNLNQASTEALIKTKNLQLMQAPLKPIEYLDMTVKVISELRVSDEAQKRMQKFLDKKN